MYQSLNIITVQTILVHSLFPLLSKYGNGLARTDSYSRAGTGSTVLTYHSHALNGIAVSVLSVSITQGMMCSAHAVQLKLESQNILERVFAEYPVSLCGGAVMYVLKKLKGKTP